MQVKTDAIWPGNVAWAEDMADHKLLMHTIKGMGTDLITTVGVGTLTGASGAMSYAAIAGGLALEGAAMGLCAAGGLVLTGFEAYEGVTKYSHLKKVADQDEAMVNSWIKPGNKPLIKALKNNGASGA